MILVVEDDEDVREMLEFTFRSHGLAVSVAANGTAALEALERERPCLMVLDLVMPMMTGWQVVEQMRVRKLDGVPVCVISALGTRVPSVAVASFCKPFDVRELVAVAVSYCAHAP